MNREEIIKILNEFNFDSKEYIVISGAAMVLYGIKDTTHDIDISVTEKYYRYLEDNYDCEIERQDEYGNNVYYIGKYLNFGKLYYTENKDFVEGFPIQRVKDIIDLKKMLGREKDKKDLELIDMYLNKNDNI